MVQQIVRQSIEEVIEKHNMGRKVTYMDCWTCEHLIPGERSCKFRLLINRKIYYMRRSRKIDSRLFK